MLFFDRTACQRADVGIDPYEVRQIRMQSILTAGAQSVSCELLRIRDKISARNNL